MAEFYENYRCGGAKLKRRGLIVGRWRRVLSDTSRLVAMHYENERDEVTLTGWTWEMFEAAKAVPEEGIPLELMGRGRHTITS